MKECEVIVDIVMVTYNQENFIGQAIESVLKQQSDYKYRLVISEDCSTDNTKSICRQYKEINPDIIYLIENSTNLGLVRNYQNAFSECKARYIAIIEADDYWTDLNKLQKQVLILESNHNIGLVHGNYSILQNGQFIAHTNSDKKNLSGYLFQKLILKNVICPLTVLFRRSLFEKYFDFNVCIKNNYSTIDYSIWLSIAANSEIEFIDEVLGVYRREVGSISNTDNFIKADEFIETAFHAQEYFINKYSLGDKILKKAKNSLYYELLSNAIYFNYFPGIQKYRNLYSPDSLKGFFKHFITINRNILSVFISLKLVIQFSKK